MKLPRQATKIERATRFDVAPLRAVAVADAGACGVRCGQLRDPAARKMCLALCR